MATVDETVEIRVYATRQAAEFGRMLLEGSGIPSFVRADDVGGMQPYLTLFRGARLVVRQEDAERARDILEDSCSTN